MKKEITFIVNRSEITAGTRGASLGPDAIFTAARAKNSTFFNGFEMLEIPAYNNLLDQPVKHPFAKRIEGLINIYSALSQTVSTELLNDKFPFILAGDHGSAGGTIAGIKKAFPNKRLGVIWIDAHGDLHTPYTTPSGNMHGMPLSTVIGEDNLVCKINDVPTETVALWEKLKNIGFQGVKVQPEDLILMAVRDLESQETALIERLKIKNFTVEEINEKGIETVVEKALEQLNSCDLIYISFDVDSMDPKATSYGTGTPVANGILPVQAEQILNGLCQSPKVVCVEFVEVNPCLDEKKNKMAEVAFDLIESLVKTIKK